MKGELTLSKIFGSLSIIGGNNGRKGNSPPPYGHVGIAFSQGDLMSRKFCIRLGLSFEILSHSAYFLDSKVVNQQICPRLCY